MTTTYYSGAPNAPQRQTSRPIYTYHYFDVKGRGETPRMMFAAAGVDFVDSRLAFGTPETNEFVKSKFPFQRVPVLEFDGNLIDQSTAICRYLAKDLGLAGKNATEGFEIDALGETITEVREQLVYAFFEREEKKKEKVKGLIEFADTIHRRLQTYLERNRGGDGFFIGNKISWVDIHFYCITEILELVYPDALNNFAKLGALRKRVADQPRIAEYLKNRRQTPF